MSGLATAIVARLQTLMCSCGQGRGFIQVSTRLGGETERVLAGSFAASGDRGLTVFLLPSWLDALS